MSEVPLAWPQEREDSGQKVRPETVDSKFFKILRVMAQSLGDCSGVLSETGLLRGRKNGHND